MCSFFLFLLSFSFFSTNSTFCNDHLVGQAEVWTSALIAKSSPETAQKLSELLYWSHKRSCSTLAMQDASAVLLQKTWAAAYACLATRLNPSHRSKYSYDTSLLIDAHEVFLHEQHEYQVAQKHYIAILDEVVEDKLCKYRAIAPEVAELREAARVYVVQALLKELPKLRVLIIRAQRLVMDGALRFQDQPTLKSPDITQEAHVKLLHHIWHYVPALMMKSFVAFDTEFHDISATCFGAFLESQYAGNMIWEVIETARATFYATYLRVFDQALIEGGYAPYVAH